VLAGLSGVDEPPLADVNAVVAEAVEEDEIAWLEVVSGDCSAVPILLRGVVGERHPELRVDVPHEAGAIEAGRRLAAPSIRCPPILHRDVHRTLALTIRAAPIERRGWGSLRDAGTGRQRHNQPQQDTASHP
jgi:hypothetical protein